MQTTRESRRNDTLLSIEDIFDKKVRYLSSQIKMILTFSKVVFLGLYFTFSTVLEYFDLIGLPNQFVYIYMQPILFFGLIRLLLIRCLIPFLTHFIKKIPP